VYFDQAVPGLSIAIGKVAIGTSCFILSQHGCLKNKEDSRMKVAGLVLLMIGVGGAAFGTVAVPEISPASAGSALALISGAVLVMRGRRKK